MRSARDRENWSGAGRDSGGGAGRRPGGIRGSECSTARRCGRSPPRPTSGSATSTTTSAPSRGRGTSRTYRTMHPVPKRYQLTHRRADIDKTFRAPHPHTSALCRLRLNPAADLFGMTTRGPSGNLGFGVAPSHLRFPITPSNSWVGLEPGGLRRHRSDRLLRGVKDPGGEASEHRGSKRGYLWVLTG